MVSCSGAVLCLCFPLPFVEQHGTAVHLFVIYFTQWLGPDYTDRHSRLFEGQLDLCNNTVTVPKSWERFQSKKASGKTPPGPPPRRAFLSLIPGRKNKNLYFFIWNSSAIISAQGMYKNWRQEEKLRPGSLWHFKMLIGEEIITAGNSGGRTFHGLL